MDENALVILSKGFAAEIIKLCETLRSRGKSAVLLNQFLRCGTSIGANIHEANYASSRADFINKLQISLKECYETDYWLSVFHESDIITDEEYKKMDAECGKIRRLLIASVNTAKQNSEI